MANEIERENFLKVVKTIQARFPKLRTELTTENLRVIDANFEISAQDGLVFPFSMNLQHDELHLHVGNFWCEWFPCGKQEVCDKFIGIVSGLLSGSYRVVEYWRFGSFLKAHIQKLDEQGWKTIAWSSKLHIPIRWGVSTKILQNVSPSI